jgi:hypothetical protein
MKTTERRVKLSLERKIKTFKSNDGSKIQLTQKEIDEAVTKFVDQMIENHNESGLKKCTSRDTVHEVHNFTIDENVIKGTYDESNKETYNHFIHKFLRDYYNPKGHAIINKGDWAKSKYNPTTLLHERLLSGELNTYEHSVKGMILQHLVSGVGGRGIGHSESNRTITKFESETQLKEFFKFILDSGMFGINDRMEIPESFQRKDEDGYLLDRYLFNQCNSFTLQETFIHLCYHSNQIDVIYWLHDEYGMDLTINESNNFLNTETKDKRVSIMARLVYSLNNNRIHEVDHNGYLDRVHDRDGNVKEEFGWMTTRFFDQLEVFTFLVDKYPTLKFEMYFGHGEDIVHNDIYNFLEDVALANPLSSKKYGEVESATEFLDFFKKYDTKKEEEKNFIESMEYFIKNL